MAFPLQHKPKWWFKSIHESKSDPDMAYMPEEIEYLNVWTGETFVHIGGTAYWDDKEYHGLNLLSLVVTGITHYRVRV